MRTVSLVLWFIYVALRKLIVTKKNVFCQRHYEIRVVIMRITRERNKLATCGFHRLIGNAGEHKSIQKSRYHHCLMMMYFVNH